MWVPYSVSPRSPCPPRAAERGGGPCAGCMGPVGPPPRPAPRNLTAGPPHTFSSSGPSRSTLSPEPFRLITPKGDPLGQEDPRKQEPLQEEKGPLRTHQGTMVPAPPPQPASPSLASLPSQSWVRAAGPGRCLCGGRASPETPSPGRGGPSSRGRTSSGPGGAPIAPPPRPERRTCRGKPVPLGRSGTQVCWVCPSQYRHGLHVLSLLVWGQI